MKEAITFHKYALPIVALVCVLFYGFNSNAAESISCETLINPSNGIRTQIQRCENEEVICYIYDAYKEGGISCKFKEKK